MKYQKIHTTMDKYTKNDHWTNLVRYVEEVKLPISIIQEGAVWVASTNRMTEHFLGSMLTGVAQGNSKEDAIKKLFLCIQANHYHSELCRLRYQRMVPFRCGDWSHIGGHWFVIFGIHVYFRYGKNMKRGWYIPFTKLNISVHNEWLTYKRWLNDENAKF